MQMLSFMFIHGNSHILFARTDSNAGSPFAFAGKRPYSCDMCDSKFGTSSDLRQHTSAVHDSKWSQTAFYSSHSAWNWGLWWVRAPLRCLIWVVVMSGWVGDIWINSGIIMNTVENGSTLVNKSMVYDFTLVGFNGLWIWFQIWWNSWDAGN